MGEAAIRIEFDDGSAVIRRAVETARGECLPLLSSKWVPTTCLVSSLFRTLTVEHRAAGQGFVALDDFFEIDTTAEGEIYVLSHLDV